MKRVLLPLIIIFNISISLFSQCDSVSDSLALVALYNSASGENWTTTWNLNEPFKDWFGVSVNEEGCVRELILVSNGLSGTLPEEIVSLNNLELLLLSNNNLSGNLPNGFGALSKLNILRLDNNNFSGCFPDDLINQCAFISGSFTNNPLLPWQGDFSEFCNGEEQMGANCDDGISETSFDSITENCSCLGTTCEGDSLALVALYIATNGANWDNNTNWLVPGQAISSWFGVQTDQNGCVTCVSLDAAVPCAGSGGDFVVLTGGGGSVNMGNQLSGSLPPDIGNLEFLEYLNLTGNQLQDVLIPSIGNLTNLRYLYVSGNELQGEIPEEIGKLSNLEHLHLSDNQFQGPIPADIFKLSNLITLDLSFNKLSKTIPPDIGDLCDLEELYLNDNELEGCPPAELSQLENLIELNIDNNNFSCSEYPSELITLCELDRLTNFSSNNLPNFDSFCANGTFTSECFTLQDSLLCNFTTNNILREACGDISQDSTELINISVGLVAINNIDFAYLKRTYRELDGSLRDTTTFIGCSNLIVETCITQNTNTVCNRGVVTNIMYDILDFREAWNCTMSDLDCSFTTSISVHDYKIIPFEVYPNPSTEKVYFSHQANMDIRRIRCINLLGQAVNINIDRTADLTTIDVNSLESGLYLFTIDSKEIRYLAKVLVQK